MDRRDIRIPLGTGMGVERAELRREGGLALVIEHLIPEEDHLVPDHGGADGVAGGWAQRLADVDAGDLGADGRL